LAEESRLDLQIAQHLEVEAEVELDDVLGGTEDEAAAPALSAPMGHGTSWHAFRREEEEVTAGRGDQ